MKSYKKTVAKFATVFLLLCFFASIVPKLKEHTNQNRGEAQTDGNAQTDLRRTLDLFHCQRLVSRKQIIEGIIQIASGDDGDRTGKEKNERGGTQKSRVEFGKERHKQGRNKRCEQHTFGEKDGDLVKQAGQNTAKRSK